MLYNNFNMSKTNKQFRKPNGLSPTGIKSGSPCVGGVDRDKSLGFFNC